MIKEKNVLKDESFKKYRNQILYLLKSKQIHYDNFSEENKKNCKAIWTGGINEVICQKNKKKLNSPTSLIDEGKIITNSKNIAEHFNKLALAQVYKTKSYPLKSIIIHTDYLLNPNKETFFITPTTDKEIPG